MANGQNVNSMNQGMKEAVRNEQPPMGAVEDDYNAKIANGTGRMGNQMANSGAKNVLGDNELEPQHDTQPAPGAFGREGPNNPKSKAGEAQPVGSLKEGM